MVISNRSDINKTFYLVLLMLFVFATAVFAGQRAAITPYGDYCREVSVYGVCRDVIPAHEAITALHKYYSGKGCSVVIIGRRDRFIIADIFRNFRQVDKIIFDTRTGRLRSIN